LQPKTHTHMKEKMQMTRQEFLTLMLGQTHRQMAYMKTKTMLKKEQMKGGKATAAKYGGFVTKNASITFNHGINYENAVKRKLIAFELNPEAFVAEEHPFIKRALYNGKLTSMGFHKADEQLPLMERRWYVVTYIMNGCVKSVYDYVDANGVAVDGNTIHADLYDHKSKKQADAGLVNIEDQVMYRNYSINSVVVIHIDKMEITLI